MRKILDRWFANSPWWIISAGIHVVLLLGATLVCLERLFDVDVLACPIVLRDSTPVLPEIPAVRDVIEHRAPPVDTDPSETIGQQFYFDPDSPAGDFEDLPVQKEYGSSDKTFGGVWGSDSGLFGNDVPGRVAPPCYPAGNRLSARPGQWVDNSVRLGGPYNP